MSGAYDYGLWALVASHVGLLGFFAASFLAPRGRGEWRSFGALVAFIVALYTEMYGFPLTIYLLTALLGRLPVPDPFAHASGNLWGSLVLGSDWAGRAFMALGGLIVGMGAIFVMRGWSTIHAARGGLVTEGLYGRIRHPQYVGLALFVVGALVQWPTVPTLLMAPVLLVAYARLARREEAELEARFGDTFRRYRAAVPAFLPRTRSTNRATSTPRVDGLAAGEQPITPKR